MTDAELPPPPVLSPTSTRSNGGIPIYTSDDINVLQKSAMNFDDQVPAVDRLWYGRTTFALNGDKWTILQHLNSGAEGQTYLVTKESTQQKLAVKFCSIETSQEIDLVQRLPRALVVHPNFVSYKFMVLNVGNKFAFAKHMIFMEHVPNGELFDLLASAEPDVAGKPVSEGTCRRFMHDIISGMGECYKFGVTHRDLKPENLLLNEEGRIVIIDLGHAKRAVAPRSCDGAPTEVPPERTTTCNPYGTVAFNAPEVKGGCRYDCELADVWSVGVIAFYLHAKLPPFKDGGGIADWSDIKGTDNATFWKRIDKSGYYPQFPVHLKAFINALWRHDPKERPRFEQLVAAIGGDAATLQTYPDLQWLAQPLNSVETFVEELRKSQPNIELSVLAPGPQEEELDEKNLMGPLTATMAPCKDMGTVELDEVVDDPETLMDIVKCLEFW